MFASPDCRDCIDSVATKDKQTDAGKSSNRHFLHSTIQFHFINYRIVFNVTTTSVRLSRPSELSKDRRL